MKQGLKKPIMPTQPKEFHKKECEVTIGRWDGITLRELLDKIPADVDHDKIIVKPEKDYNDEIRVQLTWSELVPNPKYAKELAAYEKKLVDYNAALVLYQAEKKREQDYMNQKREKLKPTLDRIKELEKEIEEIINKDPKVVDFLKK